MALQGAEILFYPTAIGSEPQDVGLDSRDHWKRVMQGHAGANVVSSDCFTSVIVKSVASSKWLAVLIHICLFEKLLLLATSYPHSLIYAATQPIDIDLR